MRKEGPVKATESMLPEIAPCPNALAGGFETLEAAAFEPDDFFDFNNGGVTLFNLPLLYQLRQRSYHAVTLGGPFDLVKLAQDHRQHVYRSEVALDTAAGKSLAALLLGLGQGNFFLYENAKLRVFAPTPQAALALARQMCRYRTAATKPTPGFYLISITSSEPYAELVELDNCPGSGPDELALHYGDGFSDWETPWLAQITKRHSGLTIFFGPPGVGKTTYLKTLMARFAGKFVFYYLPISSFDALSAPQFVAFWLRENTQHEGKTKLVVLEDAEDLLLPRDDSSRAKVSNLLNIGDGFLGEHLKLHLIATANVPIKRLDSAVVRPGRLMGTREFHRLTWPEAQRLAQAKGLSLPEGMDTWSLAEVYNGHTGVPPGGSNIGFSAKP